MVIQATLNLFESQYESLPVHMTGSAFNELRNTFVPVKLTLGFSPCPNDTFIFFALINRRIDLLGLDFIPVIEDVETLNRSALKAETDITKMSFATYARTRQSYDLLDAGSALGNNCGPLLISRRDISEGDIAGGSVGIPGEHTTANFLFSFFFPKVKSKKEMLFSEIEDAVIRNDIDAGVIIHENRFTYASKGLKKISDLGEKWHDQTGLPIPLGGIGIKRSFPVEVKNKVDHLICESILYAWQNPGDALGFVKEYSGAMEETVMWQHIRLYVNDYTLSLGIRGKEAVDKFLSISDNMKPPGL